MIRTLVDRVQVRPGDSCFIEVHGERLLLKHWERGTLKEERWLRATALPVGRYEVLDGDVLHLHDPKTVIDELHAAQLLRRARSPEFHKVLQRIAKATGGRVRGDIVVVKARTNVDLARLQKTFGHEAVVVYFAGRHYYDKRELAVQCADSPLDALKRLQPPDGAIELYEVIDARCGITGIDFFVDDAEYYRVGLRLGRAPAKVTDLVRAILKSKVGTPLDIVERYEQAYDEGKTLPQIDPKKELADYYRKRLASSLSLELTWGELDI
jgi:hypothetical protein